MRLIEVQLAERKPQYSNFTDEQVIQMFFKEDKEQSREAVEEYDSSDKMYGVRHFYVKSGLVVHDDRFGDYIGCVLLYPSKGKKKGRWVTIDNEAETEWQVQPSKFKVDMTQAVYRK